MALPDRVAPNGGGLNGAATGPDGVLGPPARVAGFQPPPYPYERLEGARVAAAAHAGGVVDLSIGTPCDPPPAAVVAALAGSGAERGYPPSIGTPALRQAFAGWFERALGVRVPPGQIAACVGTKEFVATLPQWLKLRRPWLDSVLYPAVAYPTYAMGAILAGCRPVAVPLGAGGGLDLDAIDPGDAERALCLWVNSPANPTGALDDLAAAAAWGRGHDVPVFSDECYVAYVWRGRPRTILETGFDGVMAVHSLSKRSNLAGVRVGCYAGDAELVDYLAEVRKHVGLMVPGPAQAAAVVALGDEDHVEAQRERYWARLSTMATVLERWAKIEVPLPAGGFYLWVDVSNVGDDGWQFTERLARAGGALVSPGELYGPEGASHVRIAVVQPDDRLELVAQRLGVS